ncbi:MAG: 8-amino-7-oxononanoate synthase [Brevinematales bacterium]|nr:8-amino-7-oxononanoate synthase [Brevinematales bacterium]
MIAEYENLFRSRLEELEKKHLRRIPVEVSSSQGRFLTLEGKTYLSFGSNSYLGLGEDKSLIMAGIQALKTFGSGSGGSRLVNGNYTIHRRLEKEIATLKGQEDAILFATGFQTNVSVITALFDAEWVVFCDRLNHASLIDGIRFSGARLVVYRHLDMEDLENKAKKWQGHKGVIVTDGVFSMDGDIAPLDTIVRIARHYGFLTMVDDAHGTGILGENGSGTSDLCGVKGMVDIEMGTFSKAFASEGGFVASRFSLIEYLRHFARGYMFSTALPPHVAAISQEALRKSIEQPWRRKRLQELSSLFRKKLQQQGWNISDNTTPIVPFFVHSPLACLDLSHFLREKGIFVPAIRPPAVKESRLRFSLMATHTEEDIEKVVHTLCLWREKKS